MATQPLEPPTDRSLLNSFVSHFGITLTGQPTEDVARLAAAFSRLPYENLTKILRHSAVGCPVRRSPQVVLEEHLRWGAGGTCFSLTAAFLHLVRSLGLPAEPILADRPYGQDTHAALVVWIDGKPHLVDPGYLLHRPIPLDSPSTAEIATPFNRVILTPSEPGRLALATSQQGQSTHRLTFRLGPVDAGQFLRAWDNSFDWDMMHYPVLSRVTDDRHLYLQRRRLQTRGHDSVDKREIPIASLADEIAYQFGMDVVLVREVLAILNARGDLHG